MGDIHIGSSFSSIPYIAIFYEIARQILIGAVPAACSQVVIPTKEKSFHRSPTRVLVNGSTFLRVAWVRIDHGKLIRKRTKSRYPQLS